MLGFRASMLYLWRVTPCGGTWTENCIDYYNLYERVVFYLQTILAILWAIASVWLTLKKMRNVGKPRLRLLRHLQYGPIATLVLMMTIVFCCDMALIEYSRWKIVRYIHSNESPLNSPSFDLYNDYRGWCGNGYVARFYGLYGDVPVPEFNSKDPSVRARALRAAAGVCDWSDRSDDGPFIDLLNRGRQDSDPLVRRIAEHYWAEMHRLTPPGD